MRVLVTGASGFIGSRLVAALAAAEHEVFALVRDGRSLPNDATVIQVDLALPLDRDSLPRVDIVIHLAQANVPFPSGASELYRVNTMSTQELLEFARQTGSRRFVLASSGSIYGLGKGTVTEKDARRAGDFYAVTKRNAEQLVEAYRTFFSTIVLRPFTPYGPAQQGRLIPSLISRIREGRPVILNEDGHPKTTPLFIDDVVRIFLASIELDGHHVVNLAGDEVASIRDLAELIGKALEREPRFEPGGPVAGDLIADNTLMHEVFSPGPLVPLAEGIPATALAGALA